MKVNSDKFIEALSRLSKFSSSSRSSEIYGHVQMKCGAGELLMSACNQDEFATEKLECEGEIKPCIINMKSLSAAVFLKSEFIEFGLSGRNLSVNAGSKCVLHGLEATFPSPPESDFVKAGVIVTDLRDGIKAVSFSSADKGSHRMILQSVHASGKSKSVTCEALDGASGAFFERFLISSDFDIVIPSAFCLGVVESLSRDGAVLSVSPNMIRVEHESGGYYCKQLEGGFPNTATQRTSKEYAPSKEIGQVNAKEVADILSVIISLTQPNTTPSVNVSFKENEAAFKSDNFLKIVVGKFTPHECRMNAESFKKCLSNTATETVKLFGCEMPCLWIISGDLRIATMEMREK